MFSLCGLDPLFCCSDTVSTGVRVFPIIVPYRTLVCLPIAHFIQEPVSLQRQIDVTRGIVRDKLQMVSVLSFGKEYTMYTVDLIFFALQLHVIGRYGIQSHNRLLIPYRLTANQHKGSK